jgi:hypothetical protein
MHAHDFATSSTDFALSRNILLNKRLWRALYMAI